MNPSREVLERIAKHRKYVQGERLEIGRVVDDLIALIPPDWVPVEPEYLRLAREAHAVPH